MKDYLIFWSQTDFLVSILKRNIKIDAIIIAITPCQKVDIFLWKENITNFLEAITFGVTSDI